MGRFHRVIVLNLWAASAVLISGCMSGQRPTTLPMAKDTPLVLDVPVIDETGVARSQKPDLEGPLKASNPKAGIVTPVNIPRTKDDTRLRVSVRAWVNARPIFDDEVVTEVFFRSPPPKAGANPDSVLAERFNQALDKLIERELLFQDASKKLEGNKRVLDKLHQAAATEFEKKLSSMIRGSGMKTKEEFKEKIRGAGINLETMRRLEERDFIANEYIRNRIFPLVLRPGHVEIRRYYEEHLNEFQSIDRVEWQDIFLAVGPKNPTLAHARAAAEELVSRVRKGETFDSLLKFDDGDSFAYRKGLGYGNRKGEIKPADLEQYLFKMKEGDIGPLYEMPTGIHLFRLVKRDFAGQMPFDEKVQSQISNKLRNEVADREYRRIIRDLKDRAVIEINRNPTP